MRFLYPKTLKTLQTFENKTIRRCSRGTAYSTKNNSLRLKKSSRVDTQSSSTTSGTVGSSLQRHTPPPPPADGRADLKRLYNRKRRRPPLSGILSQISNITRHQTLTQWNMGTLTNTNILFVLYFFCRR